jgi:hypothetical protein
MFDDFFVLKNVAGQIYNYFLPHQNNSVCFDVCLMCIFNFHPVFDDYLMQWCFSSSFSYMKERRKWVTALSPITIVAG